MKELNEEVMKEVKSFYDNYCKFRENSNLLTADSKSSKEGFLEHRFGDKDTTPPAEKKRIKKEINKYFRAVEEVDKGSDPVIEVKDLRKNHMDFSEDVYDEMMKVYAHVADNTEEKLNINIDIEILCVQFGLF